MTGRSSVAELARVLADGSRAAMLDRLLDGEAYPIAALARAARVTAPTASSHVHQLVAAGLVVVEPRGREKLVRLASPEIADLLERLAAVSAATSARPRSDQLRFARTCYDHLAGVVGVLVTAALVERAWLLPTSDNLEPAPVLLGWLADHGRPVDLAAPRPLSRACVDGTERVPHVGGQIGAALAGVMIAERWLARIRDSRALRVTERGRIALARELGLSLLAARRG